jgi:prevent-host-death family protein
MKTMTATEARNSIGQLWDAAAHGPVTVLSAGKRVAVVLSPDEFDKMAGQRRPRQFGAGKHLFQGVDVNELLAVDISEEFEEYLA